MQQHQHPDDRFALTDGERDQFRQIWEGLVDGGSGQSHDGTEHLGASHPGWSAMVITCAIFIFIGLAANSVVVVMLAAGGAVGARAALRRRSTSGEELP